MKPKTLFRTLKSVDGTVIHLIEEEGRNPRPHNITGPAMIYPAESKKSDEYYLYGIKYQKEKWLELSGPLRRSKPKDDFNI